MKLEERQRWIATRDRLREIAAKFDAAIEAAERSPDHTVRFSTADVEAFNRMFAYLASRDDVFPKDLRDGLAECAEEFGGGRDA
jgi:hypothetical protein